MNNKPCCVILLAAGKSKRFENKTKKQFCKVYNKTLLQYSLDVFSSIKYVKKIVVVAAKEDFFIVRKICEKYKNEIVIVKGGKERYNSVYNAIEHINVNEFEYIIIHDVARPLVSKKLVNECISSIKNYDCVIPGVLPVDTVKVVNQNFEVEKNFK
jgi:2-C-methyl-D-erythritol 4-phosphate cytidylyltransferase